MPRKKIEPPAAESNTVPVAVNFPREWWAAVQRTAQIEGMSIEDFFIYCVMDKL